MPGGPAYYAGRAWRALGAEVRVLTAAATDFPAEAMDGVETKVVRSARTTLFQNHYDLDGRRTQRVETQAAPLSPHHLPAHWRRADVLHVVPVLSEVDAALLRVAVRPRLTGLCAQGLVRAVGPDGTVAQPPWEPSPSLLSALDVVVLGEDDVVGQGTSSTAWRPRSRWSRSRAARAAATSSCAAAPPGSACSRSRRSIPTGAGDVFAAGFLFAMAQGATAPEAARLGAAAASFVVEAPGGQALDRVAGAFDRVAGVRIAGD